MTYNNLHCFLFLKAIIKTHFQMMLSSLGAVLETMPVETLAYWRWADVQVFLDAPPSKPLLWSCLLARALQRSLSNPPLICQNSHPTSHMQLQRHWPFKMHKTEIWQSFTSHIFGIPLQTLHFIPSPPPTHPCPDYVFLHIFRYNYGGSLQMPPHTTHFRI